MGATLTTLNNDTNNVTNNVTNDNSSIGETNNNDVSNNQLTNDEQQNDGGDTRAIGDIIGDVSSEITNFSKLGNEILSTNISTSNISTTHSVTPTKQPDCDTVSQDRKSVV